MAPRNGRSDKHLKKKFERKTDRVVLVSAIAGLVAAFVTNGAVQVLASDQTRQPVPEFVFWILGAAIVPDLIKFIRGGSP